MSMNRQTKRMMAKQGTDKPARADAQDAPPAAAPTKEKRTGPRQYLCEVRGELRKVAWPTRPGGHQLDDRRAHRRRRDDHADLRLRLRLGQVRPLPLRLMTDTMTRPIDDTDAPDERRRPATRRGPSTSRRDDVDRRSRRRRRRRRASRSTRSTPPADADARRRRGRRRRGRGAEPRAEPVRPARPLVRRAHLRGLREQGEAEPRQPRRAR